MDLHVWTPDEPPHAAVLVIQEIFGVGPYIRAVAQRLADAGYLVGAPDIFWRFAPNWEADHSQAGLEASFEKVQQLDFPKAVGDCIAALEHLRAQPGIDKAPGVVGFCLGGTMAYLAASRTDVDAAVGYYGTRIHLFTAEGKDIAKALILHFGELDHTTPPELLQGQILPAIAGNPNVQPFVYPKMVHAFANHRRPDTYDAAVTEVADARTFAHFRKWLEPERQKAAATA